MQDSEVQGPHHPHHGEDAGEHKGLDWALPVRKGFYCPEVMGLRGFHQIVEVHFMRKSRYYPF